MDREVAAAQSDSEADLEVQHTEALTSARSGRLQQARTLSRRAVERTRKTGHHERAAVFQTGAAVWGAFYGYADAAQQSARDALRISRGRDVVYGAAFALALTGEVAEAQTLADELAKRFPEDISVLTHYLPTLRGLLALQRKDAAAAVVQLEAALPNELGIPATNFVALFGSLYSAYVRGQAFQALGRSAEAVAEFQKILDHRGLVFSDPVGAMARLHLARALTASGDRGKARAAYQDLLTLWNGADADLAIVQQAKAEAANLP
jgi:tetratricopeptide (TPR) repeat protein